MNRLRAYTDVLFEASFEVCNKVGGIYTVLASKAALMKEYYGRYIAVGPYFEGKARLEFRESEPPADLVAVFADLKKEGITAHFGVWQVKGEPNAILIEFGGLLPHKNDIKRELWEIARVDSLNAGWEFEEPMLWSWAVGMLVEKFAAQSQAKVVAHFHEWLAGFGLLYLRSRQAKVGTVFTTHATMLGRALAGSGRDLYGELESLNPDEAAYRCGVQDKYTAERAAAKAAHVFTTVSEITGMEAAKVLGRRPDILVLNGLDMERFPTIEEISIKHISCRDRIREYLVYHFFPYYNLDLEHTLIYFTLCRYEYKNKGLDLFIESLGKLNEILRGDPLKRSVAVFFWVPMGVKGVKTELLLSKNIYRHIKSNIHSHAEEILNNLVMRFMGRNTKIDETLFSQQFLHDLQAGIVQFKRQGNPLILTHDVENERNDAIVSNLVRVGLDNKPDDPVKVIVYPVYLDGNDSLLNLSYYDAMAGCHLGIFPSYYEPWGYTPLESAAMGVPAITSDLAGFGRFVINKVADLNPGMFILRRLNKDWNQQVEALTGILYEFARLTYPVRVQNKIRAREIADMADWKDLITNYIEAHNLAVRTI